jgi:hypothetical protein
MTPNESLSSAITASDSTYASAHADTLGKVADNLKSAAKTGNMNFMCLSVGAGFDALASLKISCGINPSSCLLEILNSGLFGLIPTPPALYGAALAGSLFSGTVIAKLPSFPPLPFPPPLPPIPPIPPINIKKILDCATKK